MHGKKARIDAQRDPNSTDIRSHSRSPAMYHRPQTDLAFVETFVDALTVRPFLNDLRRTRKSRLLLQALVVEQADETRDDTATAA
jgi:hypothetical protein